MRALLLIAAALIVGACATVGSVPPTDSLTVYSVDASRAQSDADVAAARGDFRLMAIQGYSLDVPGTDLRPDVAQDDYGLRIIEGGTDAYRSDEERRVNEAAYEYATDYNRRILQLKPTARP